MMVFLFSLSCSLVVFLLFYGFIAKKVRPQSQVHQRLLSIQNGNIPAEQKKEKVSGHRKMADIPFVERVVRPFSQYVEQGVSRLAPKQLSKLIGDRINMAGKANQWSVNEFIAASLLGFIMMSGLMIMMMSNSSAYKFIQQVIFTLLFGVMGGLMPTLLLNIAIKKRQAVIQRQLPEVLDLLCVSVQAGLSFDASLRKIVARMKGPFVDECRRMQEDIQMGMVRRTAMHNVAKRCQIQDVSLFMTSLIQAERLGTSMSKTLKNQADNIRERRRQYVKAEAMKAPVKIIFPLVIFIFPALFVIALIPSILSFMKNM
ncbi:MAG: type II secretion system F family protein [Selenomonas sp.]|nr:type II secretion system F family protein [Selenomonas sp.]